MAQFTEDGQYIFTQNEKHKIFTHFVVKAMEGVTLCGNANKTISNFNDEIPHLNYQNSHGMQII